MLSEELLRNRKKEDPRQYSKQPDWESIGVLVECLSEKDDKIRYQALTALQECSRKSEEVYPYWEVFADKLKSDNSYQRSIGIMLIAENAKWDKESKLDRVIDDYLKHLDDEKPITIRQCIQSLSKIVPYKQHLSDKIADKLMAIQIKKHKETMQKLILSDILTILILIKGMRADEKIDTYLFNGLNGEILDKKRKKAIESML